MINHLRNVSLGLVILLTSTKSLANTLRIVSLAPNLTETLFELGMANSIVGVTNQCDYPVHAKDLKKVGNYGKPSLEILLAQKPTHVIATEGINPTFLEQLKKRKITLIPFYTRSILELKSSILSLGKTLKISDKAQSLVHKIESKEAELQQKKTKKQTYLAVINAEPIFSFSKKTFMANTLALGGYENILKNPEPQYPQVSKEFLLTAKPDIVFITRGVLVEEKIDPTHPTAIEKITDKLTQKKGFPLATRVVLLPPDVFERAGPRVIEAMDFLKKLEFKK